MRLIDADNLLTAFPPDEDETFHTSAVRGTINACQTVDAVPVRCKDCLHNRACEIQYHAQAGDLFFCGAAERKDGEAHD